MLSSHLMVMGVTSASVYEEILSWPTIQQLRYVRGFADGEAGPRFYFHKAVNSTRMYPNIRMVVFSNTDLRMLNTVRRILLSVGIQSTIYLDQKAGQKKATKDSFVLSIMRGESLTRFQELVGFTAPSKSKTLKRIVQSYKRFTKTVKSPLADP